MSGWWWAPPFVYFAVVEGIALYRSHRAKAAGQPDPTDTLSEWVWIWFGFEKNPRGEAVFVRRTVLVMFLAWLVLHFIGGGTLV